jgi:beta-galactosidase
MKTMILMLFTLVTCASQGQVPLVDHWKYTLRKPADNWAQPAFDDAGWQAGPGGFGTRSTPGARVGTNWGNRQIFLRKRYVLKSVPEKAALLIHHDEDAQVYINGKRVGAFEGYLATYKVVPLTAAQRSACTTGRNVLAVRCVQRTGGQFIDVHLVDADKVPKLPRPKRGTKPFLSDLVTSWGAEVKPENAWTEYPRPQLVREAWHNLNGHWDYAITPLKQQVPPAEWKGKILVPFALESKLGGVQRLLETDEALWYRRVFTPPGKGRTRLNFEAVDYRCEVFVNRRSVGSHQGGHTPFSFDVTEALKDGENELIVRVQDETEGYQLRGKQVLNPRGIWYTRVSGIWQTVWLESVGSSYIEDLTLGSDARTGSLSVRVDISGKTFGQKVKVVVKEEGKALVEASGDGPAFSLVVPDAKLWSPTSPHLYDLELSLLDPSGRVLDRVRSYAGIRNVGQVRDKDGHLRFTLNGKEIFHWGPLDQGWWPDGLLTPPSDQAMLFEIGFLKAAGFNMIRKHIKVEPRRYYYHCDKLGMLVWQDQVSAGKNPAWTRLKPQPKDARWPEEHHIQFMTELERMIDTLENHPSIVVWVPFNEAWGQHRTIAVGEWTVRRDPSRLVNVASGGNFWPVGHIVDAHAYPHPVFPLDPGRFDQRFIKVMGEFGGHGWPVVGHLWDNSRGNWGYGGLPKTIDEYKARYVESIERLVKLKSQGISGGVYTQTTDVEGEVNGLLSYDRKIQKLSAEQLADIHRKAGVLAK